MSINVSVQHSTNKILTKLDCVAVNVKPWLHLLGSCPGREKKKMKDMVRII